MANGHGDWVWYELMTPDAAAAERFYGPLLGWRFSGEPDYREIEGAAGKVGGVLSLTAEMTDGGARPGWLGYVLAADVDRAVESVVAGGGRLLMPARDLAHVGRFAMVADPDGAAFYLMTPEDPAGFSSPAFAAERPELGHCAWNELGTSDIDAAFHFYGTRFGWVKDGEMDMGPAGTYAFVRHGAMIGGMAQMAAEQPAGWTFYFRVASIPAAVDAVTAGGGRVTFGPQEIPGGDHIIIGTDPQGADFALVGAP